MDRASARRGRAPGDRPPSARPSASGGRPRRRPPRPSHPHQPSPRAHPRSKNKPRKRPPPPSVAIKLVVRRLPPTLTVEQFRTHANPKGADKALWNAYYPGKVEAVGAVKRSAQVLRHSVAYLAFEKLEDASHFFNEFDGFKFVDPAKTIDSSLQSGTDYFARVERAMFQTTPLQTRRRAPPATEGTIESDPDYLNFLAEMKGDAEREQSELTANQTAASSVVSRHTTTEKEEDTAPKGLVITPLIEDVRARRKERDERKKSKSTVRGSRGKGRGGAAPPSASVPPVPKAVESVENVKLGAKRKKRRAGDNANASKRDDPARERKGAKSGASERRNGHVRQTGPSPGNSTPVTSSRASPSSPFANNSAAVNGGSGSKGGSTRGGSGGRSRYPRGQKGRSRYAQNGNGTIGGKHEAASSDAVHGPMRVLKKEASVTNKT